VDIGLTSLVFNMPGDVPPLPLFCRGRSSPYALAFLTISPSPTGAGESAKSTIVKQMK
jgi:hypothetical protein